MLVDARLVRLLDLVELLDVGATLDDECVASEVCRSLGGEARRMTDGVIVESHPEVAISIVELTCIELNRIDLTCIDLAGEIVIEIASGVANVFAHLSSFMVDARHRSTIVTNRTVTSSSHHREFINSHRAERTPVRLNPT